MGQNSESFPTLKLLKKDIPHKVILVNWFIHEGSVEETQDNGTDLRKEKRGRDERGDEVR